MVCVRVRGGGELSVTVAVHASACQWRECQCLLECQNSRTCVCPSASAALVSAACTATTGGAAAASAGGAAAATSVAMVQRPFGCKQQAALSFPFQKPLKNNSLFWQ